MNTRHTHRGKRSNSRWVVINYLFLGVERVEVYSKACCLVHYWEEIRQLQPKGKHEALENVTYLRTYVPSGSILKDSMSNTFSDAFCAMTKRDGEQVNLCRPGKKKSRYTAIQPYTLCFLWCYVWVFFV